MKSDRPVVNRSAAAERLFAHGESAVVVAGVIVLAVFLTTMSAMAWNLVHAQRDVAREASGRHLRAVGDLLAKTTDALLAANEMSTLRCVITEAGVNHNLDSCRIVLPDGSVIAAAEPSRITLATLPDSWPGSAGAKTESLDGEMLSLSYPIDVPKRGPVSLEIVVPIAGIAGTAVRGKTAAAVISGLGFISLLLVYRHARRRLRAIGSIRRALLAMKAGEEEAAALEVSPAFGAEAEAWNQLLADKENLKKRAALEQARDSLLSRSGADSEIRAACDSMPHGLMLIGNDMRAIYANGAASVLLQTTPERLVGAAMDELGADEKVIEAIHNAAKGPTYKRTIVEIEREGSTGNSTLRFIVRPVRREDLGIAMVIIEDITQQRVAEASRNSFLAQATHELRTPLTNIRMYVEMALEDGQDDPVATGKCLNTINEESRRLERIVSDILSISEIEVGSFKLKRDDVRLEVLFEQLKADYEPQTREKQVELNFDVPPKLPVLHADRDKIALALHNLLGNALKYTPADGRVTLHASVDDQKVTIDVTDTGIGISEDDMARIFEKFYRAKDKRIHNITGSGLGLALAREVIRLHGGDIAVESELNKGSTFTLTLPISSEAA